MKTIMKSVTPTFRHSPWTRFDFQISSIQSHQWRPQDMVEKRKHCHCDAVKNSYQWSYFIFAFKKKTVLSRLISSLGFVEYLPCKFLLDSCYCTITNLWPAVFPLSLIPPLFSFMLCIAVIYLVHHYWHQLLLLPHPRCPAPAPRLARVGGRAPRLPLRSLQADQPGPERVDSLHLRYLQLEPIQQHRKC